FRYRLHWLADHAWQPALARVAATRSGQADGDDGARLFVVDLAGGSLPSLEPAGVRPEVQASAGTVRNAVAYRLGDGGRWRMSFDLLPGSSRPSALRARLLGAGGQALSETWLSRWTA